MPQIEIPVQIPEDSKKDIEKEKAEEVFVPPDERKEPIVPGAGSLEGKKLIPRTKLALEAISELGLHADKIIEGSITDEMIRQEPYNLIIIKEKNRMILVCDKEGNKTFVIYESGHGDEWPLKTKDELREDPKVAHIIWNPDTEKRKKNLKALILAENPPEKMPRGEGKTGPSDAPKADPKNVKKHPEMNRTYFENPENAKHDLSGYAKELGEGKTIENLNTENMRKIKGICKNGETVNGNTYLLRAEKALGMGDSQKKIREEKRQQC